MYHVMEVLEQMRKPKLSSYIVEISKDGISSNINTADFIKEILQSDVRIFEVRRLPS